MVVLGWVAGILSGVAVISALIVGGSKREDKLLNEYKEEERARFASLLKPHFDRVDRFKCDKNKEKLEELREFLLKQIIELNFAIPTRKTVMMMEDNLNQVKKISVRRAVYSEEVLKVAKEVEEAIKEIEKDERND